MNVWVLGIEQYEYGMFRLTFVKGNFINFTFCLASIISVLSSLITLFNHLSPTYIPLR